MTDIDSVEVEPRRTIVRSPLTLYEVHAELQTWADTLELAETDEDRAAITERMCAYLAQGKHCVDEFNAGYAYLDSQLELAKAEIDRLSAWKRRVQRLQDEMEAAAVKTLEALGVKKLDGNTSFLRIQKKPDAVEITCLPDVPVEYKRVSFSFPANQAETIQQFFPEAKVEGYECPKKPIADALKAGTEVPGARLTGGNSLRRK